MAALTTCIRRHRAALDAAGVDVEALKGRLAELRTVDGLEPRVAAMTAVEEFLDEAEGARAGTVAEIERQGGQAPAFEYRRGAAPTAETVTPTARAEAPTESVEGVPRPEGGAPMEEDAAGATERARVAAEGSTRLRQQRAIEERARFESLWVRLMEAESTRVPELVEGISAEDARAVIARLDAAPGDNRAVRQAIERKFGELDAEETTLPDVAEQRVFHGTPHRFASEPGASLGSFRSDKIGTGEGAQAFGYGHYVAGTRETAKFYANNIVPSNISDISQSWVGAAGGDPNKAISNVNDAIAREVRDARMQGRKASTRDLRKIKREIETLSRPGSLYVVDLPDEAIEQMLDWDAPLSEQPSVMQVLEKSDIAGFGKSSSGWRDAPAGLWERAMAVRSGEDLYLELTQIVGSQADASATLKQLGIPGIRYLDAGSRGAGGAQGTRNFVVFPGNERLLRILEVLDSNGQPLSATAKAEALKEQATGPQSEADEFEQGSISEMRPGGNYTPLIETQRRTPGPAPARAERAKPISRADVIEPFVKALGVPLYTGRMKKARKALGYYLKDQETVRVKRMNDLEVTAHELAHLIDDRNPDLRRTWKRDPYRTELKSVSYDEKKVYEGFAEFVRLWMSQPETLPAKTPQWLDFWENWLRAHPDKAFSRAVLKARDDMLAWHGQHALARLESKHGQDDPKSREAMRTVSADFRQSITDDMAGILAMETSLTGERVPTPGGPYETARLAKAAYSIVDGALRYGVPVVQADGSHKFEGPGLVEILKPVQRELDDWVNYAVAKSAAELKAQGRENLFTAEEIQAGLALETPEFLAVFDAYQRWNRGIVKFAIRKGLLGADQVKRWQRQFYIPFYRVAQGPGRAASKRGGIEGRVTVTKRLTGGTGELRDVLNNMVHNASTLITEALKNEVRAKVADTAQSMAGGGRWLEQIPTETRATQVTKDQVVRHIEEAAGLPPRLIDAAHQAVQLARITGRPVDLQDVIAEAAKDIKASKGIRARSGVKASVDEARIAVGMVEYVLDLPDPVRFWLFGQDPTAKAGDQVFAVYRQGKPTFYEISDPLLWRSLVALNPKTKGAVRRLLSSARRLGQGTITLTPDFMLANIWRDTWHGFALSRSGFKPVLDSLRGMRSRLTADQTYRDYIANGGGMASYLMDEDAMRRRLESFYEKRGVNPRYVMHTGKNLLYGLELLADAFEVSTRMGEYRQAIARGEHPRHATYRAREISTDFAMRGDNEFAGWAYDTIIFLKAAVNGLDRAYRGFTKDVNRGAILARSGMIAALSAMLAAWNSDDERYRQLEDWDRDAHWHVFLGDLHLRFPKIWEIGAMASSAERATLAILDEMKGGAETAADLGKHLWRVWFDLMKFEYVPYVLEPVYEIYALNRERFTGRQIETPAMQTRAPGARWSPYTSRAMVALGEATLELPLALQISPAKAEAMLRGYFNTAGLYGIWLADALVAPGEKPARKLGEYPALRRFVGRSPGRTQAETDFWNYLDESRQLHNAAAFLVKESRPASAVAVSEDRRTAEYDLLESTYTEIRDLNHQQAEVYRSRMTPEKKREALDEIQRAKNAIFIGTVEGLERGRRAAR